MLSALARLPLFGVIVVMVAALTIVGKGLVVVPCLFTLVTVILPVVGNLLANPVPALISIAVSPWLSTAAAVYLIAVHKTEYSINVRTVGSKVSVASAGALAAKPSTALAVGTVACNHWACGFEASR